MPTGPFHWKQRLNIAIKKTVLSSGCQMENGSVAQERQEGGGGGDRYLKVRTTFFPLEDSFFFCKTTRRKHFIFQSLSPQALQNVDALLSSWKIRAMIILKKSFTCQNFFSACKTPLCSVSRHYSMSVKTRRGEHLVHKSQHQGFSYQAD